MGEYKLDALIYLFIINVFITLSLRNCNIDNLKEVTSYNLKLIKIFQIITCLAFIVIITFKLPLAISNFISSTDIGDLRNSLYGARGFGNENIIIRWLGQIFSAWTYFLLFISFFNIFIRKKTSFWDKLSIILYFMLLFQTLLGMVSRSSIIYSSIELIVLIIFFRGYIPVKTKKIFLLHALVLIPLLYILFSTITYSRVSDRNKEYVAYMNLRYAGEAQLNFTGLMYPDANQLIYGYYQFRFFRQLLGLPYPKYDDREGFTAESTYISTKYKHPYFIFYSTVGDYYLNWGKYFTLVLFCFLFLYIPYKYRNKTKLQFMQLFYPILFGSYFAKGVFYTDLTGASGNLLIILLIFMHYKNGKCRTATKLTGN